MSARSAYHSHATGRLDELCQELANFRRVLLDHEVKELLMYLETLQDELGPYRNFNELTYQRNRIVKTEFLDLLMLCWRPTQRTPIHDHAGSICGVLVLEGQGTEVTFTRSGVDLLVPSKAQELAVGEISVALDSDTHMFGNFSSKTEDLVTVHCYSPPLQRMTTFTQSHTFLSDYDQLTERATSSGYYQVTK